MIIQNLCKVMRCDEELSFTRSLSSETMLAVHKYAVIVKVSHDVRGNDVFRNFAAYAGKGDWSVVLWIGFISFLKSGVTRAFLQSSGRV